MGHPDVLILGYSEAAMLLMQPHERLTGVISIRGRHEPAIAVPQTPVQLVLSFDDVEVPEPGDEVAALRAWAQRRWEAEVGRPTVPPAADDADRIICFARAVGHAGGVVVCQCHGGISRSAGAALLCLATWTGPGEEPRCVEEVLRVRPSAAPHAGLVALGDRALGRDGKLFAALAGRRLGDR